MSSRRATLIVAGLAAIFALLSGCASVKSTAVYYKSIQDYPAKPGDAPIPILTAPPGRPYKVIFRERSRLELSAQKHDLQCPNSWSRRCAAQEL
jgi:hypothetical protein